MKITGYGLAAGCQVFYRKIYGFFYSVCVLEGWGWREFGGNGIVPPFASGIKE